MHTKKQKLKLRRFLAIKEVTMLALVVVSLGLLAFEHLEAFSHQQLLVLDAIDVAIGVIFLAEFVFELYYARDRRRYWRHNWFFLLAAVPIPTATFEILRSIRALRLVKLAQEFASLRYEHNTRLFEHNKKLHR